MKGCLGLVLAVLVVVIAAGLWSWHSTESAADAYRQGAKERVSATVVSAQMRPVKGPDDRRSHPECFVTVTVRDRTTTIHLDALSGACDDNTPLHANVPVELEYWQGKVTAIYDGPTSWLTLDNPALLNAFPQAQIFFAGLAAVPVAGLLILDYALGGLIKFLRRRGLLPPKRAKSG